MLYKRSVIESLHFAEAPEILSSDAIEEMLSPLYKRLKLPEKRLETMSGIKERRLWQRGFKPSDAAIIAGQELFKKSSIAKSDIGCIIMCSVCRDFLEPATATVVHQALGLPENCLVFDLSNACLGVLTGILVIADMIELGRIKAGLVVAGENSRALLENTIKYLNEDSSLTRNDIKKHFSSLTIGSGAFAALISSAESAPSGHRIIGSYTGAFTEHNHLCRGSQDIGITDGLSIFMNTDSEQLMQQGVKAAAISWERFKKNTGWNNDTPDIICTHQVGSAHRRLLFEKLSLDVKKDFQTLEKYGNMGSVSCPATLALAEKSGKLKKGNKVALLGIGSGINCTMIGIEW